MQRIGFLEGSVEHTVTVMRGYEYEGKQARVSVLGPRDHYNTIILEGSALQSFMHEGGYLPQKGEEAQVVDAFWNDRQLRCVFPRMQRMPIVDVRL